VADTPTDIFSVAIGDAESDGGNEIAIGMWSTTNELRIYEYNMGSIAFTSHENGGYVKGTVCLEAKVTSESVDEVRFYLNNELKHVDTSGPYQYILDTSSLDEDTLYSISAQGIIPTAPPIVDSIELTVNNIVESGSYISANTMKSQYAPGSEVSVAITINSPPTFDTLNMIVSYADPSGNMEHSTDNSLPCAGQYLVGLPIFGDAQLGIYDVSVSASGYHKESQIWNATSATSFEVVGSSISQQIANLNSTINSMALSINTVQNQLSDIQTELDGMSLSDIRNDLDFINQTLSNQIDGIYMELQEVNGSLRQKLDDMETNLLNGISGNDTVRLWLEPLVLSIESELANANTSLHSQLSGMDQAFSTFYSSINADLSQIATSLSQLDADLTAQHNAISDSIYNLNKTISDAPCLSTEEIMDRINDSIQQIGNIEIEMNVHDVEIKDVLSGLSELVENQSTLSESELLDGLTNVVNQMQLLEYNISSHDSEVQTDLGALTDLISDIENIELYDLETRLSDLAQSVSTHNAGMGQYIMVVEQTVSDFENDVALRLQDINDTLGDLNKLDSIIGDINELDSSLQTANGKAQSSSDDDNMMGPIILLSVFIVIALIGVFYLYRENRTLKESLGIGK
jgi:hypothetical protein